MIEARMEHGHLILKAKCEHDGECAERHLSMPVGELSKRVTLDTEAVEVEQLLQHASSVFTGDEKTRVDRLLSRMKNPGFTQAQIEAKVAAWSARAEAEVEAEAALMAGIRKCAPLKDCWCDNVAEPGTADHNNGG